MPTCTPIYGLPYPVGSDRPCDQSETWCDFAAGVDARLDILDDVVDRTVDTIPMAQVRLTTAHTQPSNPGGGTPSFVPFDTVDVDTANMVDLASDPYIITLPRFGAYFVYFTVEGVSGGAGNQWRMGARTPTPSVGTVPSVAFQLYLDDGSTPVTMSSSGLFRYLSPVPAGTTGYTTSDPRVVLQVDTAAVALVLTAVTFGIHWMRDLP